MQCHEFESRWNELLDERRPPERDPVLLRHAAHCADCRDLLAAQAVFVADRGPLLLGPSDPAFAARVVALAADRPQLTRTKRLSISTWKPVAAALSVAAALLMALFVAWQWRTAQPDALANQSAQPPRGTGRISKPGRLLGTIQPGPGRQAPNDANPTRTAYPAKGSSQPTGYRGTLDELAFSWPEAASRLDEIERLAPGLRPLRESLAMFWETLRRAVVNIGAETEAREPRDTSLWWMEAGRVA